MQVLRAGAHGLSRGIISVARGGTFKSGFASGFTSSFLSPGNTLGGNNGGGFTLRTSIASIVGGTASKLGGGKFSNGAVSGAFVHMFNAEGLATRLNVSDGLTTLGGVLQVATGGILMWTGVGSGLGAWMIGLGANNIVAGVTGTNYMTEGVKTGLDYIPGTDSSTNHRIAATVTLATDLTSGQIAGAVRIPKIVDSAVFGKRVISPTVNQNLGNTAGAALVGANVNSVYSTGQEVTK